MGRPKNPKPARILTSVLVAETLELMRILDSTIEEATNCIIWTGATTKTGHPIIKKHGGPCCLVRREVYRLCVGELVFRKPLITKCGHRGCINPKHILRSTTKDIARLAAKHGAWKTLARAAKIAATKRLKGKLTMAKANEIRMSSESGPALARRYGVDRSLIIGIKNGKNWKDHLNPYGSLMEPRRA
jgi:hypothetical protein